jgi:photosystem II stability/assembly factor-like uncharacterized protein
MAVLVLGATAYSFSPRPLAPFPATVLQPEDLQINGLAEQNGRWIAVGELGRILIADAAEGPWREARVHPSRGSTLTQVAFVAEGVALAIGHDGIILRSRNGGETWEEVAFDETLNEPLLALSGPHDGVIHAVGGFGRYLVSSDLGQTWTPRTIEEIRDETAANTAADNPYSMFNPGIADRHLNALIRLDDGRLLIAGEGGLLARSADGGKTWEKLPSIYAGSFFGALALPDNGALVFGMRGHVFRSEDGGETWQQAEVPDAVSLFGGYRQADGRIILVGASNTLWISDDGGRVFRPGLGHDRAILADVRPVEGGWLTAGENGLRVQYPPTAQATTGAAP